MRKELELVMGSVATRDVIPVLTHVAVHDGQVLAFNGRVLVSTPAPVALAGMSFTVPAARFAAAIEACGEAPCKVTLKEARLSVRAGGFRADMGTGDIAAYPLPPAATPKRVRLRGGLLAGLQVLRPFIGNDATRPWVCSVKLVGGLAYATNNVVLVRATLPQPFPVPLQLPVFGVDELLRIGLEPTHVMVLDGAATFWLPGGTTVRCTLFAEPWAPAASQVVDTAHKGAQLRPVPPGLLQAVQHCSHFCPDAEYPVIQLQGTSVRTLQGTTEAEVTDLGGPLGDGKYRCEPLLAVLAIAGKAAWDRFPRVPWATAKGAAVPLAGVLLGYVG